MIRQLFRLYLFLLVCFSISVTATAQTVDIPDPNLRTAIEKALGKASGATITMADIANLTRLSALFANISDLTGLEAATNLRELNSRHLTSEGMTAPYPTSHRWHNSHIRHLTAGRIKQPDRTVSCGQLNSRHLTAGRIKQPKRTVSCEQLNIRHLTAGRIKQPDTSKP